MAKVDHDEVRRMVGEGLTFKETAQRLGVSAAGVSNAAHKMGLSSPRHAGPGRIEFPKLHDADWLRAQFDARRTIVDVAYQIGVHYATVSKARQRFGIAPPRRPWRRIDEGDQRGHKRTYG